MLQNRFYSECWDIDTFVVFKLMFVYLDLNSHQTLESPPAAAEEGVADGLTCATVLTRVGNTSRYLHLTAPSGVLGVTAA